VIGYGDTGFGKSGFIVKIFIVFIGLFVIVRKE
jgi:hypothetical protein